MPTNSAAEAEQLRMTVERLSREWAAEVAPTRAFKAPRLPRGVVPKGTRPAVAMDDGGTYPFLQTGGGFCGLGFPGYSYLSELAQRSEYRAPAETTADEMTREWIKFTGASEAESEELKATCTQFGVQGICRQAVLNDSYFGRAQIYIDIDGQDTPDKRNKPLLVDKESVEKGGIGPSLKGKLNGFKSIEPIWSTPQAYNSNDPTKPDFYTPDSWYVMGVNTHATRLLTLISRPLPDILKPAYNFSGMSMSQLIEPYVVRWLKTVDSVNRLLSNFSTSVILTDLGSQLQDNGKALLDRLRLMTLTRDNRGILALNKASEEFAQNNIPLGGLADLQMQALEHMAFPTHIPLMKLTGQAPGGLGATGEGEIKVWYDHVGAQQEVFLQSPLSTMLNVVQLHLWGKINPKIGFEFVPLDTPTDKEMSEMRKADGDRDVAYVSGGIVSADETRQRLRDDPNSGYTFITGDAPPPPEHDGMDKEHELGQESADADAQRSEEAAGKQHERTEESADNQAQRDAKLNKGKQK